MSSRRSIFTLCPYTTLFRSHCQEDDEATVLGDLATVVSITGDLSRALRYLDEAERLEERTTSTDTFLRLLRGLLLRSEEHTSELQSRGHLVCRLLLEKKKKP